MNKSFSLFEVQREADIPFSESPLFQLENPKKIDKSKKTIAILTWNNFRSEYNYVHGFLEEVIDKLKEEYNIIYIGKEESKNIRDRDNFFNFVLKEFHKLNGEKFLRKKECEGTDIDNVQHNHALLVEQFQKAFQNIEVHKVIYANSMAYELPITSYFPGDDKFLTNEFHDYVGDDPEETERRNNMAIEIANKFNYRVSVLAFSMFNKNIFANLCIWLNENHPIDMNYSFVLDPVCFHKIFEVHNIPFTQYYFNDDKRGTRDLTEFPIAHLQHLINERKKISGINENEEKTMDFFWMGSIFNERGIRSTMWDKFFDGLNLENSKLWAPLRTNGVFTSKKAVTSKFGKNSKEKAIKKFPGLVKKIEEHPMYSGHLLPDEVSKEAVKFKYGFIMRCVSMEDSLNFRPVQYVGLRILPLLDPQYDPAYLQIPKEIQDKLKVESAEDITERVNYFNAHPEEREEILDQLHKHFKIDEFMTNWENEITRYFD